MNPRSFTDYPAPNPDDWKKLAQKELGEKPLESLIWKNENGFDVSPYCDGVHEVLDMAPLKKSGWIVHQDIWKEDLKEANQLILESLEGGVNSIGTNYRLRSFKDLDALMKGVHVEFISLDYKQVHNELEFLKELVRFCDHRKNDSHALSGSLPGYSALYLDKPDWFISLAAMAREHFSKLRIVNVYATRIHNAGGTPVQELVYALSHGNELLHFLTANGFTVDEAAAMIQFDFNTGSSFFVEIAKYRVFRHLWSLVVAQYHPEFENSKQCFIAASTSGYLYTLLDIHNNILRGTVQTMSAALGGADRIDIEEYDALINKPNRTAMRITRNIQQLLLEESSIAEALSAAEGSHYIERISASLARDAWNMFLDIEDRGGILNNENSLNAKVEKSEREKLKAIESGERIIVGVNRYRNMPATIPKHYNNDRLCRAFEEMLFDQHIQMQ